MFFVVNTLNQIKVVCTKVNHQSFISQINFLQNIYDNTCQLREKKLDIEEALQEEKKNNDGLKKDIESNNKKLKVVDSALKAAQNELEAFQVSWDWR